MTDLHKAAQQVLDALELAATYGSLIGPQSVIDAHDAAITALREAIAKPDGSGCHWPMCHNKEYQEAVAAQVMAELYTGIAVPPGYALVPVEPTPEMIGAYDTTDPETHWVLEKTDPDGTKYRTRRVDAVIYYQAMLAAAPQPKGKP